MGDPASSDTEAGASRETEIGFLAEALRDASRDTENVPLPRPSLESLGRDGDGAPCRGSAPPAEAYPGEPRARRSLFRDLLLEARGEVEEGSVVAGEGPTAYLLALF